MKLLKVVGIVLLIIFVLVGFSVYREVSREKYCQERIQKLEASNPKTDWNKQVPAASLGFTSEVKTIPLSFAEKTKCEHEQKDFFIF
jgi:hypothetical protein